MPAAPEDTVDHQDKSKAWFEDNCRVELATTTAEGKYAITQASLAPIPEGVTEDNRDLVLHYFTYDEESGTVEKAGGLGVETPFCFRVDSGEAVTATEKESKKESTFYPVETPDNKKIYVGDFGIDLSTPHGLLFNSDNGTIGEGDNLSILALSQYATINDAILQDAADKKLDPATLEGAK